MIDKQLEEIKSVNTNQDEILLAIMRLNNLAVFEADITYGKGGFYKNLPKPTLKYDIDPQSKGVIKADSVNLPLEDGSLGSVIFDPPFLTYIRQQRSHNSIMAKSYGGYWRYEELATHYQSTIDEVARILKPKGIFVFKCQDIIHNHSMHPTHINVVNWAKNWFRLRDLFILYKNNRLPMPSKEGEARRVQQHARIHHSYFLVFEKK